MIKLKYYPYVKGILLSARKELTEYSQYLSQEVKTYRNAISNVELKSINDLSDSAMNIAMNLKDYRDRLEYLEEHLDIVVSRIREVDDAIKALSGGDSDV